LWMSWGLFQPVQFIAQTGRSDTVQSEIVAICNSNRRSIQYVSNHQLTGDLKWRSGSHQRRIERLPPCGKTRRFCRI
jgi:hypothetical protein